MEELFTLKCQLPQDDDGLDEGLHILQGASVTRMIVRCISAQ
jgi:hypothetical protein